MSQSRLRTWSVGSCWGGLADAGYNQVGSGGSAYCLMNRKTGGVLTCTIGGLSSKTVGFCADFDDQCLFRMLVLEDVARYRSSTFDEV